MLLGRRRHARYERLQPFAHCVDIVAQPEEDVHRVVATVTLENVFLQVREQKRRIVRIDLRGVEYVAKAISVCYRFDRLERRRVPFSAPDP